MSEIEILYLCAHLFTAVIFYGCSFAYWQEEFSISSEYNYNSDVIFSFVICFLVPWPGNLLANGAGL